MKLTRRSFLKAIGIITAAAAVPLSYATNTFSDGFAFKIRKSLLSDYALDNLPYLIDGDHVWVHLKKNNMISKYRPMHEYSGSIKWMFMADECYQLETGKCLKNRTIQLDNARLSDRMMKNISSLKPISDIMAHDVKAFKRYS